MKTFAELRTAAMGLFKGISDLQAENAKAIAKLKEKGIYAPDYIQKCEKEKAEEVQNLISVSAVQFSGMVKTFIEAKRDALNKMLTAAPTTEQTNLLTSLQLQGANVTTAEIRAIADQLGTGNYRAIHTLQAIAQKAGIRLNLPAEYDYEQLNLALNQVEAYLKDRAWDFNRYDGNQRNWDFNAKCYFGVWEGSEDRTVPVYSEIAAILDGNAQSVEITVDKRTLTDTEITAVESLFSDGADQEAVLKMVKESPELRALVSLHPEYGKLLNDQEGAGQAE